ncbi:hypothetical protein PHLGIDRAFT_79103 [Phlebiopsis gigantea 11061_1 CR5-6]|uniref:Cytochrome P450 n=1 Tax=Phlebiopsis gigantea (strain 11061_1 CR5-6) TaxID=745531 RepID=A0A0C3RR47_PHLG1|nr:hypothetical protein PHLGIDRAFT_79103 [Phlebiopsis gigantea 11061_1 CR5-6]
MQLSTFSVAAVVPLIIILYIAPRLRCPKNLRHLPRVPLSSTLISLVMGETEERRVHRLFLPTAQKYGAGLLARALMDTRSITKQRPREDMLFWQFTGLNTFILADGDIWRTQIQAVRRALQTNVPIGTFVSICHKLIGIIGDGGVVKWSDLSHRLTLDVVGQTVMGHDFQSLEQPHGSLVAHYHSVMSEITNPLYIAFPILESWLPRKRLTARVSNLRAEFQRIVDTKKERPGEDYVSFMLENPPSSESEYLDNVVTMFMTGHDTTAGALSTVVYYLAKYVHHQSRARAEVLSLLGENDDPSVQHFQEMKFMNACIRESMRLNGPSVATIPRLSASAIQLGPYTIPPNIPIVLNLYGVLHLGTTWDAPDSFLPERWLVQSEIDDAWMPFGTGLRRCPAMNFSLYEQRTVLTMLLRKYEWTLPPGSPHEDIIQNGLSTFALNLPKDLKIDFRLIK